MLLESPKSINRFDISQGLGYDERSDSRIKQKIRRIFTGLQIISREQRDLMEDFFFQIKFDFYT